MSYIRIAIMTQAHPNMPGEVEIKADNLVDDGRAILRGLANDLLRELDDLDEEERRADLEEIDSMAGGANPGPWVDVDGIYFERDGQTYGPFATEEEAEAAFTAA